jgi:DNA-binding HxlR family transcriptional regulator
LGQSLKPVLELMYNWGNEILNKKGKQPNCGMCN